MKTYRLSVLIAFYLFFLIKESTVSNAQAISPNHIDNAYSKNKIIIPKYWIAYEYCWTKDQPLPESRWKENIDWMAKNFKSYGYDMISNDGWIEGAQTINSDGYITKYNDSWLNGFEYWSEYLSSKEMKMGVYYNPLWLTKAAYDQNIKIKGTNYSTQDIVGNFSFNEYLYWVDVSKPGAKEWIQGYVKYWIELGTTFLRIDFLENYERNYGPAKYANALKWINEAEGNEMLLSLVMPNSYNHSQTELLYGDMMRVDDDCFAGGWDFVSERRRGEKKEGWPQYGNAFDGFISFADIGGRDQMILDGDFIRLNTLANDTERKFQVSLFVMAGSPIAIADQFDTIEGSEWVYQNTELLDIHNQGFVGKPISYNISDSNNSSRWIGQLPDGDWVVGLFNREDTSQKRSIHFEKELGMDNGSFNIRDLWSHSDIESKGSEYVINLDPHACQILKIANKINPKYEAEVASMIGGARKDAAIDDFSGIGYVDNFKNLGSKVLFVIKVPAAGTYKLNLRYANATGTNRTASLYVNGLKESEQLIMKELANGVNWSTISKPVFLEAGENSIAIQYDFNDNGLFVVDYIQLEK